MPGIPYTLTQGNLLLKSNFQVSIIKNNKKNWIVRKLKNQKKEINISNISDGYNSETKIKQVSIIENNNQYNKNGNIDL